LPHLLGFEDEGATAIAVDAPGRRAAVAVRERDAALEDVGVLRRLVAGRLGLVDTEERAQVADEDLVVRELASGWGFPASDEGVYIEGHRGGQIMNARGEQWAEPCSGGTRFSYNRADLVAHIPSVGRYVRAYPASRWLRMARTKTVSIAATYR
jgi:hypothetical protein